MRKRPQQNSIFARLGKSSGLLIIVASMVVPGNDGAKAQDLDLDPYSPSSATTLSEDPLLSTRAAGMGGALTTTADDIDAAVMNPAGIGGFGWNKAKPPFLRKLYFPLASASLNQNSRDLNQEFHQEGGSGDAAVGKAIVDANAGKRQYARASTLAGLVGGRTLVAPFTDQQIAAVSRGQDSGLIDAHYRSLSGVAYGFSATDPQERLALGYSGFLVNRKDTVGTFDYLDVIDQQKRKTALAGETTKYSSTTIHNVGFIWTIGKTAKPTLALAAKNLGNTVYKAKTEEASDLTVKQDVNLGFSVTPQLTHDISWTLVVEGGHLGDNDVAAVKKYRIGNEFLFDGLGSYALLGARAGFTDAGASGGLSLNLGLLVFEVAQESVDVGIAKDKVIERRVTGSVYVNVANF